MVQPNILSLTLVPQLLATQSFSHEPHRHNHWSHPTHTSQTRKLGKYITNYHPLTYSTHHLRSNHERVRRSLPVSEESSSIDESIESIESTGPHIDLKFQGKDRHFHLKLAPDTTLFTHDADIPHSVDHLYYGHLAGDPKSNVHGAIIDGVFQHGVINTPNGTYYVDHINEHLQGKITSPHFHSVLYHESDVDFPFPSGHNCAAGRLKPPKEWLRVKPHETTKIDDAHKRSKRSAADITKKTTCVLRIEVDYPLYEHYGDKEQILASIASHVRALTDIYRTTSFPLPSYPGEEFRGINFQVKRVVINQDNDPKSRFFSKHIGVERFLEIASEGNYDPFCLAYVFTKRDFDNGVLGLAWVAQPSASVGGICESHRRIPGQGSKSMNTGIITIENYGNTVPPRVSHVTFAHEVGHNFGSPHDSGAVCTPGESRGRGAKDGNYIMYARATSGLKPNNRLFSPCSVTNISAVLEVKAQRCFKESGAPICGNGIVDQGEECDCGFEDDCLNPKSQDLCCVPAGKTINGQKECSLKRGKNCSPSQGPCCNRETCDFKSSASQCAKETDCRQAVTCSGASYACDAGVPKPDKTTCAFKTQVCQAGECTGSFCLYYDLEACTCVPQGDHQLDIYCHTCCQQPGDNTTCASTGSDSWTEKFDGNVIYLQPGSPCDNFEGYCDVYSKCRRVDADGPLRRLQKLFFDIKIYEDIRDFIEDYWWAVLLLSFALIIVMAGFIQICSIHTPSNNPNLKPALNINDTLRRRPSRRNTRQADERRQTNHNRQANYPDRNHMELTRNR